MSVVYSAVKSLYHGTFVCLWYIGQCRSLVMLSLQYTVQ